MKQLKEVTGNSCTFCIFNTFNLFLFIEAIVVLSLGIFLWVKVGSAEIIAIVFICLGVVQFGLGYIGWTSRKSSAKLVCYQWFLGAMFIAQLVATIVGIVMKDKIIDKAASKSKSEKSLEEIKKILGDNYDIAVYGTISAVAIQFFCILFSIFYKKSLKHRRDDVYEKIRKRREKNFFIKERR